MNAMTTYTAEQVKQAWEEYVYEDASLNDESTMSDYLEVQYLYNRYKDMLSKQVKDSTNQYVKKIERNHQQ
jgi:hypothetical protein